MYVRTFQDVLFIEGSVDGVKVVEHISVTVSLFSGGKSVRGVKEELANHAKLVKCDAVMNFKYGQRHSWFSGDRVSWYGSGDLIQLPELKRTELMKGLTER